MKLTERIFNLLLGATFIYWSVVGLFAEWGSGISWVRWCVTILNITIGLLLLLRQPLEEEGSARALVAALPSLLCGGLMFHLCKPFVEWSLTLNLLFGIGCTFAIVSFLFLGRNFAILPNARKIVSTGTFQLVRHPAYLGECLMMLACTLGSQYPIVSLGVLLFFIPSLGFRIEAEEKLLSQQSSYLHYQSSVKWRLLPFIW